MATLLSAQSSDSLQQVVLTFSSAVSSSASGPISCGGYFLVNGAAIAGDCTFQVTGSSQATISSTSLLPGATLALQGNGNLAGGNGVAACGSATIVAPLSPTPLSIAFSPLVPVIVNCAASAPVRFDVVLTGGGFGRAVSTTITSPQRIEQVSSTTTLNSVVVEPGSLAVGALTLRATARDALGQTASAEQTVSVVDAGTPELVFTMEPAVIVRGQPVTLRVQVQFSQCSAAQPVVVTWQNDVLASVQPALNLNSATLVLTAPMIELFAPGMAEFVVRVSSGGARSLPFETTWQVAFPYRALQLSTGSTLASATVLSEAPGTLAVQAYHPDFPSAAAVYSWRCAVAAGAASGCAATLPATATVALPGGVLTTGNTYALQVVATVAAGGQVFSASATFYRTVVAPTFPLVAGTVTYSPLGSYTAFLTSNMALDVASLQFGLDNVGGAAPLPVALSVASGSSGFGVQAVCASSSAACTPPAGYPTPALRVDGHALGAAAATFTLLLPLRGVAAAPLPGSCRCGPDLTVNVTAATGEAWALCSGWQARAFISGSATVRYRFAARPLGGTTTVQLGASTSENSTLRGLPAGTAGSDYRVAIGVLVENDDGGVFDAGEVCTLRVLPPSSGASNQLLDELLGAQRACDGLGADTSQIVLTLTALLTTASGNADVALDSDLIYALMTALFDANCSSPVTPALIVQVIDLYTALCQSPAVLRQLSAADRRNLLAIYDQILASMQLPQNAAAAPALGASLTSIGPCLGALNNGGSDVVALNGITSTITQVYVNLSSGTCQGPPLATNDTSQSVLITSSFSANLADSSFSSTSSSAAVFFLGNTTVARLQRNYSCVFLVLTSLSGFNDKNGRLPPQAMTLFDGSSGAEIPIDGDGNSIRIIFQNPPNASSGGQSDSCGDATTQCQFIDETASNNTAELVWSSAGCRVADDAPPGYTVCVCEHLTYFSALLAGSSSDSCGWTWYSIATLTSVCTAAVVVALVIVAYELRMRQQATPSGKSRRTASSRSGEVRSMAS